MELFLFSFDYLTRLIFLSIKHCSRTQVHQQATFGPTQSKEGRGPAVFDRQAARGQLEREREPKLARPAPHLLDFPLFQEFM